MTTAAMPMRIPRTVSAARPLAWKMAVSASSSDAKSLVIGRARSCRIGKVVRRGLPRVGNPAQVGEQLGGVEGFVLQVGENAAVAHGDDARRARGDARLVGHEQDGDAAIAVQLLEQRE